MLRSNDDDDDDEQEEEIESYTDDQSVFDLTSPSQNCPVNRLLICSWKRMTGKKWNAHIQVV